jgi:hypothetical protein
MNWQEVCADPRLHDLPYKIELNERGQILMSPVCLYHSVFQGKIIKLLIQLLQCGEALPVFAIATKKGTKVADLVWCSDGLWQQIKHQAESPVAQEICVEVLSSTNTEEEISVIEEIHAVREQLAKQYQGDLLAYSEAASAYCLSLGFQFTECSADHQPNSAMPLTTHNSNKRACAS